ncbi:MAG: hypothetical protein K2L83_08130 [Muribaculaceae bacterium]|nr:hypothetical protein [Muribaculaceae bacterium]
MKSLACFLIGVILLPIACDAARIPEVNAMTEARVAAAVDSIASRSMRPGAAEPEMQSESGSADEEAMEMPELDAILEVEAPRAEADSTATAAPIEEGPLTVVVDPDSPYGLDGKKVFNPSPTRAVWLSALFPGLGQIYNRRYWKLPIIVAGYMGLGYGTSWNARMYQDYQLAYSDIMDDDPDTKSYLDFFPPTVDEDSLDKTWLSQTLKSRKDYYRRNRDLCIICCVGLYLLAMLDAYVDASLSHFDISDDISLDVAPTIMSAPGVRRPTPGLNWALTF